jgi:hypothetical protein
MIRVWQWRVAAVVTLGLGAACSKGATTVDQDADEAAAANGRAGSEAGEEDSCGNDEIDDGEDCDGVLLQGVTCVNLGFTAGQLGCDPETCTFETSMCTRPPTGSAGDSG